MSIREGDRLPDFVRTDHQGREIDTAKLRGKWVVLFFYPKDNTPACTAQSCAFRDMYEDFTAAGAEVIGISADSDKSHQGFAQRHQLPFPIVSDKDGSLKRLLGVPKTLFVLPSRVTYVVDPEGVVRTIFSAWINVGAHIQTALKTIRGVGTRDRGI